MYDDMPQQDLFRLYDRSAGQREAWGNQASKVDARVEDEWDSIYVDCQDGADVDFQDFSFDGRGDLLSSFGGTSTNGRMEEPAMGRDAGGATTAAAVAAVASDSRKEGGRASVSTGGSRSALMAAMDAYQAEEEEDGQESGEEGGESKGFDEEDIIDCAIRGRWTFKNNDDPVRRNNPLPQLIVNTFARLS